MPTGLHRFQRSGDHHYVTISCYRRQPHFATAHARDVFEACLERTRGKYGFFILAYVVMPEHIHLLVTEPPTVLLSVAMQSLKISVAKRRPESPFWNKRYYDFNVYTERKWVEKIGYIHRNPVVRGLVARPEDWAWSSARTYQTFRCGVVRIESFYSANIGPGVEGNGKDLVPGKGQGS